MKNCELNTCSERTPAQCVLYTCTVTSPYITLEGCNPTLCEYLSVTENLLTQLKNDDGVLASRLKSHNCSFSLINDLIDTKDGTYLKVKTSDSIITLLDIICEQQTKINDLINGGVYNLPLPQEILDNSKFKICYENLLDPCDKVKIKTLKHLLIALIEKSCP